MLGYNVRVYLSLVSIILIIVVIDTIVLEYSIDYI